MVTEVTTKTGAIWARVSTDKQSETSIPGQIERCRKKAGSMGYIIPEKFIISTDRTSLQLKDDPKFQELYDLIIKRKIQALFVLDRDRLQAEPLERLTFMSICKENGVTIIPTQGPEMFESDEGQLIEMVLAIGKKKAVLRAQLGSKQGLYDRVNLFHKPATFKKTYGYDWIGETKAEKEKELTLTPNDDWQNVKLIFDLLLDGKGYDFVINELKRRGISSPAGQQIWNKTAINSFVHNPLYAGRYYSLREEAVTPKKRRANTYGKSGNRNKPESEWVLLDTVKIINPPITWEQRQRILDQITSHMKLSKRHAKNDYLLRGFIFCRDHYGKGGRPRVYHGHPKREGVYYYVCPVPGCKNRYLPGGALDLYVKRIITNLLGSRSDKFFKSLINKDYPKNKTKLERELTEIQKKAARLTTKQSQLEDDRYSERIKPEVYQNLHERYEFESKGIESQRNKLLDEYSQLSKTIEAKQSIADLRMKYIEIFELQGNEISNNQWRNILSALNLEIRPNSPEERRLAIAEYASYHDIGYNDEIKTLEDSIKFMPIFDVNIKAGLEIEEKLQDVLKSILLASPENGERKKQLYPLILSSLNFTSSGPLIPV